MDTKFGKYISPHLVRINERICINNKEISDNELESILEKIAEKVEIYNSTHETKVKQFEALTSLALIYFAKENCDLVVLETGLGGRDDCTNIADGNVSVITDIGLDHMDILGNTIEEITQVKAGIIKQNMDTVMYPKQKVTNIIKRKCQEKNNNLHLVEEKKILNYSFEGELQKIDYKNYKDVYINLKGKCQVENAAIVLEVIEILKSKGYEIPEEGVKKGLSSATHKARFEVLSKSPEIVFDGGHNEDAIVNLKENIDMYYPNKKRIYIVSILKTKDYKKIIKLLTEDKNAKFIFTSGNDEKKYVPKEILFEEAEKYLKQNIYISKLEEVWSRGTLHFDHEDMENTIIFYVRKFLYIWRCTKKLVVKVKRPS